jgi:hypothetical protein
MMRNVLRNNRQFHILNILLDDFNLIQLYKIKFIYFLEKLHDNEL